jgi:hypothetical protein
MKFYTSYFYNIRFFKPYQIPLSTAIWDPRWFHEFKDQTHIWKDKNGVWNGLRIEELNPLNCHATGCPCKQRDPSSCRFIKEYRLGLKTIDFEKLLEEITELTKFIQLKEGFLEEPEVMLIVHEAKDNPCSERNSIQDLWREHGIEIKEWEL